MAGAQPARSTASTPELFSPEDSKPAADRPAAMSPSPPAFLVPHPPTPLEFSQIPVEQDDGLENSPSPTPTYHPHPHRSGRRPSLVHPRQTPCPDLQYPCPGNAGSPRIQTTERRDSIKQTHCLADGETEAKISNWLKSQKPGSLGLRGLL